MDGMRRCGVVVDWTRRRIERTASCVVVALEHEVGDTLTRDVREQVVVPWCVTSGSKGAP
uniref:Uncharacterized protein n=1 Tax=Oryza nivara TaxID=4536 RepID=A0A0E0FXF9_ORYNI